jgi:hypothetical protein
MSSFNVRAAAVTVRQFRWTRSLTYLVTNTFLAPARG